jgi:hypothetical protein
MHIENLPDDFDKIGFSVLFIFVVNLISKLYGLEIEIDLEIGSL